MAGYERSTLKLVFDEEQYDGLEIRSKRLSVGAMLSFGDLLDTNWRTDRASGIAAFNDLAAELAKVLTSWNLEEGGVPVPLDVEHIAAQDFEFVVDIAHMLMRATTGVSRPLSRPSSGGDTSVEASIPMEPLSDSPTSSSEPEPS